MATKIEFVKVSLAAILDQSGARIKGKKGNVIINIDVAAVDLGRDTVMYRILYKEGPKK